MKNKAQEHIVAFSVLVEACQNPSYAIWPLSGLATSNLSDQSTPAQPPSTSLQRSPLAQVYSILGLQWKQNNPENVF
jgi:hypothetical protein